MSIEQDQAVRRLRQELLLTQEWCRKVLLALKADRPTLVEQAVVRAMEHNELASAEVELLFARAEA